MDFMNTVKGWIGALTEVGLMLIALGVVAGLLVPPDKVPFLGGVTKNLVTFVTDLSTGGLVGLIVLGFLLWLISNRKMA